MQDTYACATGLEPMADWLDGTVAALTFFGEVPQLIVPNNLRALIQRVPRVQEELRIRHGSGAFGKWLLQLAKTDALLQDDWGMSAIGSATHSDLLEIIDGRAAHKATIVTSQLPIEHWHAWIGDATKADTILDQIMQRNHRITLAGTRCAKNESGQKGEKYRPNVTAELRI